MGFCPRLGTPGLIWNPGRVPDVLIAPGLFFSIPAALLVFPAPGDATSPSSRSSGLFRPVSSWPAAPPHIMGRASPCGWPRLLDRRRHQGASPPVLSISTAIILWARSCPRALAPARLPPLLREAKCRPWHAKIEERDAVAKKSSGDSEGAPPPGAEKWRPVGPASPAAFAHDFQTNNASPPSWVSLELIPVPIPASHHAPRGWTLPTRWDKRPGAPRALTAQLLSFSRRSMLEPVSPVSPTTWWLAFRETPGPQPSARAHRPLRCRPQAPPGQWADARRPQTRSRPPCSISSSTPAERHRPPASASPVGQSRVMVRIACAQPHARTPLPPKRPVAGPSLPPASYVVLSVEGRWCRHDGPRLRAPRLRALLHHQAGRVLGHRSWPVAKPTGFAMQSGGTVQNRTPPPGRGNPRRKLWLPTQPCRVHADKKPSPWKLASD